MLRKPKTIAFWRGRLPHWEVESGRYFITIHTSGAIPLQGRKRLRAMARQLGKTGRKSPQWLVRQRLIFGEIERWIDSAQWSPHLKSAEIAQMVVESIKSRDLRQRWNTFAWVVMPTHLHLFCELGSDGLKSTIEDFKRWTGHAAVERLQLASGVFWQREWFDHWSRSDVEDERIVAYIQNNPVKAGLANDYRQWPHGSWSS
jgi:REP element-mobilizing transposase RayT